MNEVSEPMPPSLCPRQETDPLLWRSALLSLFAVTFLWGFFEHGVYALGLNTTIFIFAFHRIAFRRQQTVKEVLLSAPPLLMVALSFSLYENPFFKAICLPILPVLYGFYFMGEGPKDWRISAILRRVSYSTLLPLTKMRSAILQHTSLCSSGPSLNLPIVASIAKGLVTLLFLSCLVIIPLLSLADAGFANKIAWIQEGLYKYIVVFFPETFMGRAVAFVVLDLLIIATVLAWQSEVGNERRTPTTITDSLAAGIVLGGVLVLYLIFLWVQAEHLFVAQLPSQFTEIVWYVKSGFWQLILLSVVNILIFAKYYQRTAVVVQNILAGFTLASLLILLSAGHRMLLYVSLRGFSYEKFYASYTIVFCALLFALLLCALLRRRSLETIQVTVILFVWMFGFVSLLPVEQIVLRTNIALHTSQGTHSEVNLDDMKMLSSDVYSVMDEHSSLMKSFWDDWAIGAVDTVREKQWYEMNLSALIQWGSMYDESSVRRVRLRRRRI